MFQRERGLIPWDWLANEARSMILPGYRATLAEHLLDFVNITRLDACEANRRRS
jgi:hypothetical protein